MQVGTRVIYTEYGITKRGKVIFSFGSQVGVVFNDILFDDGATRTNRTDDELKVDNNETV